MDTDQTVFICVHLCTSVAQHSLLSFRASPTSLPLDRADCIGGFMRLCYLENGSGTVTQRDLLDGVASRCPFLHEKRVEGVLVEAVRSLVGIAIAASAGIVPGEVVFVGQIYFSSFE